MSTPMPYDSPCACGQAPEPLFPGPLLQRPRAPEDMRTGTGGRECGDGHVSSVGPELGRRPRVFPSSGTACRQPRPRSRDCRILALSLVAMARAEQKARLAHAARGSPSPGRLSASSRRRGLGTGAGRPLPRLLRPRPAPRPSSAPRGRGDPGPPRRHGPSLWTSVSQERAQPESKGGLSRGCTGQVTCQDRHEGLGAPEPPAGTGRAEICGLGVPQALGQIPHTSALVTPRRQAKNKGPYHPHFMGRETKAPMSKKQACGQTARIPGPIPSVQEHSLQTYSHPK